MSKKVHKVEEPQATYAAKKPAKAALAPKPADARETEFHRITNKLFAERKELLRRLAQ